MARDGVVLAERTQEERRSHTASLPLLVERVLAEAALGIDAVDAIAVSIGPGSFTGLRVGLALGKGMAFAGGLRLIGVPTLLALAHVAEAAPGTTVCAALDARKREVYAALFAVESDGLRRATPDLALTPEALAARLPPDAVLVGDATEVYGAVLGSCCTVRPFATYHPRGGVVARLGWERIVAGDVSDPGTLSPVYVRVPEAELARQGPR